MIGCSETLFNSKAKVMAMHFVGFGICYPACACASRGYVIGVGVHLYIYMHVNDPQKGLNRLTHLFKHSWWTSRRIYRLALQLHAPETLSLLNKSRIFLFNAHLSLSIRRMTQVWLHTTIGKYHHLANKPWNSPRRKSTTVAFGRPV